MKLLKMIKSIKDIESIKVEFEMFKKYHDSKIEELEKSIEELNRKIEINAANKKEEKKVSLLNVPKVQLDVLEKSDKERS